MGKQRNIIDSKSIEREINRISAGNRLTPEEKEENLSIQPIATHQVFELIEDFSENEQLPKPVDFFFYADSIEKAHALACCLRHLNYDVDVHPPDKDISRYSILGCTVTMDISEDNVAKWAEQMSILGSRHDCQFDGWGAPMD